MLSFPHKQRHNGRTAAVAGSLSCRPSTATKPSGACMRLRHKTDKHTLTKAPRPLVGPVGRLAGLAVSWHTGRPHTRSTKGNKRERTSFHGRYATPVHLCTGRRAVPTPSPCVVGTLTCHRPVSFDAGEVARYHALALQDACVWALGPHPTRVRSGHIDFAAQTSPWPIWQYLSCRPSTIRLRPEHPERGWRRR